MTYLKSNGNIFTTDVEAIVNPVNCVGVMGAGLAKAFAEKFPLMELDYMEYCKTGILRPGDIHTYYSNLRYFRWIINFPTKDDWRHPSELAYIDRGMISLTNFVERLRIKSVGIPALGCGLGGLDWKDVQRVVSYHVGRLPNVDWYIFEPQGD